MEDTILLYCHRPCSSPEWKWLKQKKGSQLLFVLYPSNMLDAKRNLGKKKKNDLLCFAV